jgi:uroporphyrinogen-III decarboxylase
MDEDQPWGGLGEPRVRSLADVRALPPPDPTRQGRYPLMLEALHRIVAAVGRDTAVVACFDQFPFSLAAALMGLNELMLAVNDDPALVRALMARCHEAGADVLTGGDSPAGLIGPQRYREFALPFEQRLIAELKAATGKPVSLHICGNAEPILADMARSGADVLEIDYRTDLALACRVVGPDIALWGNLDPATTAGHKRFILGSGCTLAVETPLANVDELIGAVRA